MKIEFLSTIAVITPDPRASRELYVDALGLRLEGGGDEEYHHSEQIAGCKHFGVWPLSQAAEACFGTTRWPAERPVPQVPQVPQVPPARLERRGPRVRPVPPGLNSRSYSTVLFRCRQIRRLPSSSTQMDVLFWTIAHTWFR